MKNIKVEGTKRTPSIELDYEKGLIKITGRSIPENSWKFYKPYIEWIKQYTDLTTNESTKVYIKLEYCNSSSSKYILEILQIVDDLASNKHPVHFEWYYADNDEDMEEIGQDLSSFLRSVKTQIIPYKRESPIV
ncbi:MAG: DUF1987 domain-containing protein [Bacteroidia bacterium]|nr:DUF1987 domain-containing protein [Bacteroidia bacterium]